MNPSTDLKEPFSATRDVQHPVTWQPLDGDSPAYLTLKGAVERLEGYGHDPRATEERLRAGRQMRTPFAFYRIDEHAAVPVEDELHVLSCAICGRAVRTANGGQHPIHAQ